MRGFLSLTLFYCLFFVVFSATWAAPLSLEELWEAFRTDLEKVYNKYGGEEDVVTGEKWLNLDKVSSYEPETFSRSHAKAEAILDVYSDHYKEIEELGFRIRFDRTDLPLYQAGPGSDFYIENIKTGNKISLIVPTEIASQHPFSKKAFQDYANSLPKNHDEKKLIESLLKPENQQGDLFTKIAQELDWTVDEVMDAYAGILVHIHDSKKAIGVRSPLGDLLLKYPGVFTEQQYRIMEIYTNQGFVGRGAVAEITLEYNKLYGTNLSVRSVRNSLNDALSKTATLFSDLESEARLLSVIDEYPQYFTSRMRDIARAYLTRREDGSKHTFIEIAKNESIKPKVVSESWDAIQARIATLPDILKEEEETKRLILEAFNEGKITIIERRVSELRLTWKNGDKLDYTTILNKLIDEGHLPETMREISPRGGQLVISKYFNSVDTKAGVDLKGGTKDKIKILEAVEKHPSYFTDSQRRIVEEHARGGKPFSQIDVRPAHYVNAARKTQQLPVIRKEEGRLVELFEKYMYDLSLPQQEVVQSRIYEWNQGNKLSPSIVDEHIYRAYRHARGKVLDLHAKQALPSLPSRPTTVPDLFVVDARQELPDIRIRRKQVYSKPAQISDIPDIKPLKALESGPRGIVVKPLTTVPVTAPKPPTSWWTSLGKGLGVFGRALTSAPVTIVGNVGNIGTLVELRDRWLAEKGVNIPDVSMVYCIPCEELNLFYKKSRRTGSDLLLEDPLLTARAFGFLLREYGFPIDEHQAKSLLSKVGDSEYIADEEKRCEFMRRLLVEETERLVGEFAELYEKEQGGLPSYVRALPYWVIDSFYNYEYIDGSLSEIESGIPLP